MFCVISKTHACLHPTNGIRTLAVLDLRLCSSSGAMETKTEKSNETYNEQPRINPLGVQMLSEPLYSQIFRPQTSCDEESPEFKHKLERSLDHLKRHDCGAKNGERTRLLRLPNFKLPKLNGRTLDEHFRSIANQQTEKYRQLLAELVERELPSAPQKWNFQAGWTKYLPSGEMTTVDFPSDQALIFDVEVSVLEGRLPTLATAASPHAWYSWCSSRLTGDELRGESNSLDNLIPLETKCGQTSPPEANWKERILVGHNVSYDRALIKEQYYLKRPKTRFLDTMSMHIAVAGMSFPQKKLMLADQRNSAKELADGNSRCKWMNVTSHNNLKDVHELYCAGRNLLNKDQRKMFVESPMSDIRRCFQNLTSYCAKDVIATHEVLRAILPLFLERFPHPVTLAGMFEMSEPYLPVSENWEEYLANAKEKYDQLESEATTILQELAEEASKLSAGKKYETDSWLWDLDWTGKTTWKKRSKLSDGNASEMLNAGNDYPKWYRQFYNEVKKETNFEFSKRLKSKMNFTTLLTPRLLRLSWKGHPLHYSAVRGWSYLVWGNLPKVEGCNKKNVENCVNIDNLWEYAFKNIAKPKQISEHKTTSEKASAHKFYNDETPVHNPLTMDLLFKIEDGTLKTESNAKAERFLTIKRMTLYWESASRLIHDEFVVRLNETEEMYGVILPRIVPFGIHTRRATESLWLNNRNASDRVGSELHSMIQTPPGYKFVGADIDSQLFWTAAMLGDFKFVGMHGCTPLGWMMSRGGIHDLVATTVGVSRDFAKVINYARTSGLGEWFTKEVLMQFYSSEEAKIKSQVLFSTTKGTERYELNQTGIELYNQWKENKEELTNVKTCLPKSEIAQMIEETGSHFEFEHVVSKSVWRGGTETAFFNYVEEIARSEEPRTPVLGARISRSLEPPVVGQNFIECKTNWVVESTSVDYLHLMLVCMRWLCDFYHIDARYSISIHDQIRYLASDDDQYRTALALQISNLFARAMFASQLGMHDLPQSAAFLEAVDIDTVLRKKVSMDCKTPSSPDGLQGRGVPPGKSLDVFDIFEKTNGNLELFYSE